jgi:hypothetical protein
MRKHSSRRDAKFAEFFGNYLSAMRRFARVINFVQQAVIWMSMFFKDEPWNFRRGG